MINPPGIINKLLPTQNKYTNFTNIKTIMFTDLLDYQIQKMVGFVNKNFYREKNGVFMPLISNIIPYFKETTYPSFISFYYEEINFIEAKTGKIVCDREIVGLMTSKPLLTSIFNKNKDKDNRVFDCYYVDYLCVKKNLRKKGIAPKLIQTHHYNQSHLNKKISVSLFKREGELTGIVPICVYTTYGFPVVTWHKPLELSGGYKIISVNKHNINQFIHFFNEIKHKFDITITPCLSNLIELIKSENIYINMLLMNAEIVSVFFFRKTCVVHNELEALSCFGSINTTTNDVFIHAFKISFWQIAEKYKFGYCIIEEISDNYLIIANIKLKTDYEVKSPTAYFFYNYAYTCFKSNKVFILN
jgi:hypothetical protein